MKTMIVAIDYSATSRNALHFAAHLAQVCGAEPHKAGSLELALKGSTTREVTSRTHVPLLILQNDM